MGITKQQAITSKPKSQKERSSIDWGQVSGGATSVGVDWGDADPSLTNSLIYVATRRGMAVSFSATSNGQGVSVTILDGSERPKWYANSADQLDVLLKSLVQQLTEM